MRAAVIGAGVVGTLIARELCRYPCAVLLLDRAPDVGWGITKANSAIVHAGFHDAPGTTRARFCVPGNALFDEVCGELDVPLVRVGAWVLALDESELEVLEELLARGRANGVPGLALCSPREVLADEPAVNPAVAGGLWAPSAGITEPWALALAAAENAIANGADLRLGHAVTHVRVRNGRVYAVQAADRSWEADLVINAAGLWSDRVAAMAGLEPPPLTPRRGQYVLLDKAARGLARAILFPAPNPLSKGILVLPTVDGGILLGPTAEDLAPDAREDTDTTAEGLEAVVQGAQRMVPGLDVSLSVKVFAGLRPESPSEDFEVGATEVEGFYQAAAMRSPGLTAAPALARWLVREQIAPTYALRPRPEFRAARPAIPHPGILDDQAWNAWIERDPPFGKVICHCNQITEGEVVEAIRRGARTLDGVKFRTRAGFGRCQGGSCTDEILLILARELGIEPSAVDLGLPGSTIVRGEVRP